MTFDDFSDHCRTMALDMFMKPEMDGVMLLLVESEDKQRSAMWAITFENENQKSVQYEMIRCVLDRRKVKRYGVISMAWRYLKDNKQEKSEMLLVISVDRPGEKQSSVYDVNRSDSGEITGFSEIEPLRDKLMKGDLITFMSPANHYPKNISTMAEILMSRFLVSGEADIDMEDEMVAMDILNRIPDEMAPPGTTIH